MTGGARTGPLGPAAAGALSASAALTLAELLSRTTGTASLLRATGATVIDRAPEAGRRWAILNLGTTDKPALLGAIAIVVALLGAAVGVLAQRHRRLALVATGALSTAGLLAAISRPQTSAGDAVIAALTFAAAWTLGMRWAVRVPTRPHEPQPGLSRRAFIGVAAGATLTAVAASSLLARSSAAASALLARAAVVLPRARRPLGPMPPGSELPVRGITPLTTTNGAFYRIDTALVVPAVTPSGWRLRVDGALARPLELTFDELLELPMVEADVTLVCVSNEVGGRLVSSARWLGVPLGVLLDRVRPTGSAEQLVGWSVDGFSAGFPISYARDQNALVAVGMNGRSRSRSSTASRPGWSSRASTATPRRRSG